jgi:hypothetical protein
MLEMQNTTERVATFSAGICRIILSPETSFVPRSFQDVSVG